jgi:hypothetical protein
MAKIDKTALLKAPKEERILFFGIAHLANEIKAYEKLYLWSTQSLDEGEGWAESMLTMSLMLTKALAGKLYEGYQMLERDYLNTNLYSTYNSNLSESSKSAIEKLRTYFQSDNLIESTRNQFSFHYSPKKMDRVLKNLTEDLKIYIETNGSANNLYYFAELLANYALLFEIDPNDWQAAFRKLKENLGEIVQLFSIVCDVLMKQFIELRIDDFWQDHAVEVQLEGVKSFTEIQLPWFTDTETLFKDAG